VNSKPILISLTGRTCSGKNYIFEKAIETFKFNPMVSATTRPMRNGEVEGKDYYFIDENKMGNLITAALMIESVQHGKYTYGVTTDEFNKKVNSDSTGIIILTPDGVSQYELLCKAHKITFLKFFVQTPFEIRKERLVQRTMYDLDSASKVQSKVISDLIDRCMQMNTTENFWNPAPGFIVLDGTDVEWALETIKFHVENSKRNYLHMSQDML
jgi:guanylate kinase